VVSDDQPNAREGLVGRHYAHRDANDLASAIANTQDCLYQVKPQVLCDGDANKVGILRALRVVREGMAAGAGMDLAVVHFSGHGALVEPSCLRICSRC
jgi:hypothetical protein